MINWHEIWEKKGNLESTDLVLLDGFENREINPQIIANKISNELDINKKDRILEIGCGAGMIAQYLKCNYVGVDYSKSLVKKHIQILNNSVLHGLANNLLFKDKTFDKVFCYSVFHYFKNKEYAFQAIDEMKRVSKKMVFIGDLPFKSHENEHLLFDKEEFSDWIVTDGFYNEDRFNISFNHN
jgi:ubiquinone/menaquinone biosynthesis C-methylase UbiE